MVDRPLEEPFVRLPPVRDRLEPLALVAGELQVNLARRDNASFGDLDDPARRALLKPEALYEVEGGLKLSAFDITNASAARTRWSNAFHRLFEQYDFLVMPTAQLFPFDINETWPHQIAGKTMRTYHEWMMGVCLVTLSGCPSLAMPAGFSSSGLPMGIQIIAPIHHDMDCLKLGHAYEQASNWTAKRLPPLLRA